MSNFTSGNLIDNINKNFPSICGHVTIGYLKAYQIEQYLLNIDLDLKNNTSELVFLENLAAETQYLKKYFLMELVKNFINVEFLNLYIQDMSSRISETIQPNSQPIIEELSDLSKDQKGGSSLYSLINIFVVLFFYNTITNASSVGNSMSFPNQVTGVSINIDSGKMPKAISSISEELNPLNETQMQEFTKEFGTNVKFPLPKTIESVNLTEIYGQDYIKKMELSQGMLDWLVTNKAQKQQEFNDYMLQQTQYINDITKITYNSLENMCKQFIETSDSNLPIPIYELLNRELEPKFEELKQQKLRLLAEKENQLINEKKEEKGVVSLRPGIIDTTTASITGLATSVTTGLTTGIKTGIKTGITTSVSSIKYLFSYTDIFSTNTLTTIEKDNTPQKIDTLELEKIYEKIDTEVHNELTNVETIKNVEQHAFQILASEVIEKISKDEAEKLASNNLKVYLGAVCKVAFGKIPKYVFNTTSGQLYIKDTPQSRHHIMVLAKNVASYYDTIIKGVPKTDEFGDVTMIQPDEKTSQKYRSLYEKALTIIPLLTEYDMGVTQSLAEGHESSSNPQEFFNNIYGIWTTIKNSTIDASEQFPVTLKEQKMAIKRAEKQTDIELQMEKNEHDNQMRRDLAEIARNQDINDITTKQWNLFNEYFGIYIGQTIRTGTIVLDSLVNSTSDLGVNALINVGKMGTEFTNSFLGTAWGIVYLCSILSIPIIGFLGIRSGIVSAIFKKLSRDISPESVTNGTVDTVAENNPIAVPTEALNNNRLVLKFTKVGGRVFFSDRIFTINGKKYYLENPEDPNSLKPINTSGGKRRNNRKGTRKYKNKRTKKNNKHKSNKLTKQNRKKTHTRKVR